MPTAVEEGLATAPNINEGELIDESEDWWRDHQLWLESRGYMLRPRFRPGWVASWLGTDRDFIGAEDGNFLWYDQLMEARRISDNRLMGLKRISKSWHPHEIEIANFLLSEPRASDPRNHTVPVIEVFDVPDDDDLAIIVMPFLRPYDDPRFDTIGEVVDFFSQIFEGLLFMHQNFVAHRDCNIRNIMLDPTSMYPNSFHPASIDRTPDYKWGAKHYTRTQRPSCYYFIDFGISRRYSPEEMPPNEDIIRGGDKTVPEHDGSTMACNPFPTDVYFLGNMIREEFLQRRYGFEFMRPLVEDMVQKDPLRRPSMDAVVSRFKTIHESLSSSTLRSRVVEFGEHPLVRFLLGVAHWTRRIVFVVTRVPRVPTAGH